MSRIYLSPPDVGPQEKGLVAAAIDSNWVAPVGPDLALFEEEVAALVGRCYGVALSSGTAALHLALRELGVGPGDYVAVPTMTFVASANPVAYLGAQPVFIDSDPATWTMAPDLLAAEIEESRRQGRALAAVVAVDLYGQCADYDALRYICDDAGLPLVEDAAEALGALYRGQPAGSFGASAILSFNGNKIVTTGGGGMLVTDDEHLALRVRHLATQAREPFAHYEHVEVGYNYRLSNLLAAFGRGQIADLDRRVERRRSINSRYRAALAGIPGVGFLTEAPYGRSTCWLTCITLDPSQCACSPRDLTKALEAADIESRPTWKPMHLQPVYRGARARLNGTAERVFETGVCLPSGSGLGDEDLDRVLAVLLETLR